MYVEIVKITLRNKISIGHHNGLKCTSEPPANLLDSPVIELGECYHNNCFRFVFGVTRSFIGLPLNCIPHIIIKEVAV